MPAGSEEERWFLARHLENHTFDSGHHAVGGSSGGPETEQQHQQRNGQRSEADGDRRETAAATGFAGFASDVEAVRVIVVRITDVRISDWKGGVRDWELGSPDGTAGAGDAPLVNGTR